MNNQSTPDDASPGLLDPMRQGNATLSTPVTAAAVQPTEIHNRFADVKSAIIDLIKNTAWTSNSSKTQQRLLQAVDNLENVPENTAHLSAGENTVMDDYMRALEHVRGRLEEASAKYGGRNAGKRDKFKHSWAHLDRSGGVQVLEACRSEVDAAVNRLRSHLKIQPAEGPTQNAPSSSPSTQAKAKSNLSSNLKIAQTTFNTVETVSGTIPLIGTYVGAAAKLGSTIVDMWQGMDSNKEAAKSLEARMAALAEHLEYFQAQPKENQKEETNERIRNLQLQLKLVGGEIETLDSKGAITRAFLSRNNAETLNGFQEQIKAAENEIHVRKCTFGVYFPRQLISSSTATHGVEINAERRALLDRLGDGSYGAHGDTIEDATCLKGTREAILKTIDEWIYGTSSRRVLWICGMAGRGKSTIAASVALQSHDRSPWALFHFRRGRSTLEKRLICALAKQLESRGSPEVRRAILRAVRENEDIAQGRLDQQFEVLLVNPLKDYPAESSPILLIVDALDECEDITYAARFIELIDKHSPLLPQNIKFILTTRPEPPLVDTLRSKEWEMVNLDQIADIHHDIELFIRSEFSKIKKLKSRLPVDWPSPDSIQKLVTLSEGLFQWASTAVRYMGSGSPDHRLQELLKDSSKFRGLDNLYRQILSNAFQKAEEDSCVDLLHRALATLVVAPHPISLEVIAYMFMDRLIAPDTEEMKSYCAFMRDDIFPNVASLLLIPASTGEPIQLMHTSIRDLLIDAKRCGNCLYSVDVPQTHWNLAQDCLQS
ncbi:hypothetical protein FS837_001166 [Tulasnella sp. UAMH 9824]|nr:hypothetical protein FS837_001166 [Tulasnella sp. UAMH 9824]